MKTVFFAGMACVIVVGLAQAQQSDPGRPAGPAESSSAQQAPDSLVLYFNEGAAKVRPEDQPLLDKAARLYRTGHPILMTVTGAADATGSPEANIRISQQRADAVYRDLVARGIPADRFQIVAKGQTDPAVQSDGEQPKNRVVVITWK